MTIALGLRPNDPAEPAATRALLQALDLRPREAALILGISERDMGLLMMGRAHVDGPRTRWDARRNCWVGAWGDMAETLTIAARPHLAA
jgi:hypothetical protein